MKEERRDLTLGLGEVSLERRLGAYYIDMRPALVHYTDGTYGGDFDEHGVPRIPWGKQGQIYYPINVAQYGLMRHAEWIETHDPTALGTVGRCVDKLEELKSEDDQTCVWWHRVAEPKYGIDPPWASAMAQGEAISLYLRLYQETKEESLLTTARRAFYFMHTVDAGNGGVRRTDENGYLWLEEFPTDGGSYVLNGFVYAILGLYDLYRVTSDEAVMADLDRCLATLEANLHRFDAGYWSLYDLHHSELVRWYYQKNVHVPQMAVLHRLSGREVFQHFHRRWESQLSGLNFLFVRLMYRVRPRWRRLMKALGRA